MGKKDPTKPGIVYVVTDAREPDRVRYVGRTVQGLEVRKYKHWSDSKKNFTAFPNWLRSRADRPEDVIFTEISWHHNVPELNKAEIQAIAYYRSIGQADLNLTDGGDGSSPGEWSEERKRNHFNSVPRGDDHVWRKLTRAEVDSIRARAMKEYVSVTEIANTYGISVATASEMLRNETWFDPEYSQDMIKKRGFAGDEARNRKLTSEKVREIRELRQKTYRTNDEIGKEYGVSKDMIWRILNNLNWPDEAYDPSKLVPRRKK